jgi:hypothetical protein
LDLLLEEVKLAGDVPLVGYILNPTPKYRDNTEIGSGGGKVGHPLGTVIGVVIVVVVCGDVVISNGSGFR